MLDLGIYNYKHICCKKCEFHSPFPLALTGKETEGLGCVKTLEIIGFKKANLGGMNMEESFTQVTLISLKNYKYLNLKSGS